MKRFINGIEEHRWADFCQDWIERRDGKKHEENCNYGAPIGKYGQNIEFYSRYNLSTIHLRAEEISTGELFEIRILCADAKIIGYPIIVLVNFGDYETVKLFDCDGLCSDGLMKLHYESCFFDPGDYVVTTQGAIGIYANGWYTFACLERDGKEHLDLYGCGQYVRLATEDEVKQLNEMLRTNNKKWNNETKQLEMYKINEFEVLEIIDKAVEFGVNAIKGKQNTLALQIGSFWLEGYIYANKSRLTEDDIKSLHATMNNYRFM